jgi:hypothetical protein
VSLLWIVNLLTYMEARPTPLTAYLPADALGERLFAFRIDL